jgi:hypothetical protein
MGDERRVVKFIDPPAGNLSPHGHDFEDFTKPFSKK